MMSLPKVKLRSFKTRAMYDGDDDNNNNNSEYHLTETTTCSNNSYNVSVRLVWKSTLNSS